MDSMVTPDLDDLDRHDMARRATGVCARFRRNAAAKCLGDRSHPEGHEAGRLPVELPARYRLRVNLKTAKTIGLSLPQALLARADELVE